MIIIKKIIGFEKELLFKTKVSEITSISLEHSIDNIEEDLISGNFHINGDYKMTQGSINREKFDYNIGFDIALDSRYDTKNMIVDIDDFTYKIINDEILKVKIDLYVDGDLLKEEVFITKPEETSVDNSIQIEELNRQITPLEIMPDLTIDTNILKKELKEEVTPTDNSNNIDKNTMEFTNSILDNIDSNETYATYKIYIVKEEDTIEKIVEKYNISKETLSSYNNIDSITMGDKIIIPTVFNG